MAIKIPNKVLGGSSPKKPTQPISDLPYEQVAKAFVEAIISLKQHIEAFSSLEASISQKCSIPEVKPLEVIFNF